MTEELNKTLKALPNDPGVAHECAEFMAQNMMARRVDTCAGVRRYCERERAAAIAAHAHGHGHDIHGYTTCTCP